jgi:two-component system, response regulator YesN
MVKLLIADRDMNERIGINWLITSYSIPFQQIYEAGSLQDVFHIIENEKPEVICMEIDMIPKEAWDSFKGLIKLYKPILIIMTAEATFERASQGIELHAQDLWVKPQSPDNIKRVLMSSCRTLPVDVSDEATQKNESQVPPVSYRSLFLSQEAAGAANRLMLMQLENPKNNPILLSFLSDYPFHTPPVLLPLSERIVCVFTLNKDQPSYYLKHLGNRLLMEWEKHYSEPMSIVIYETEDPLLSLNQKYLHAKQALEICFFKGYRQISVIKEKVDWRVSDPFLTPEGQRTWIDMLNDADKVKIKEWMYSEFLNLEEPFPEPGLVRTRLASLLAQVRRFMKSYHLDDGKLEVYYHDVFETILYHPILYRIVQDFLLFIYDVLDGAKRHQKAYGLDTIEQAIQYIEKNYTNADLRLEDVSEHVGLSPAYLSSQFTKKRDQSFRQILTDIRIKAARRLLVENKMSVQAVSKQVGFSNSNYFSRIFKEKTTISPNNFKKRKNL